jgi:hypothetical protein
LNISPAEATFSEIEPPEPPFVYLISDSSDIRLLPDSSPSGA